EIRCLVAHFQCHCICAQHQRCATGYHFLPEFHIVITPSMVCVCFPSSTRLPAYACGNRVADPLTPCSGSPVQCVCLPHGRWRTPGYSPEFPPAVCVHWSD